MTAIIYFGEMAIPILLAIILLATMTFRFSSAVALSAGSVGGQYLVPRFVFYDFAPTQHGCTARTTVLAIYRHHSSSIIASIHPGNFGVSTTLWDHVFRTVLL